MSVEVAGRSVRRTRRGCGYGANRFGCGVGCGCGVARTVLGCSRGVARTVLGCGCGVARIPRDPLAGWTDMLVGGVRARVWSASEQPEVVGS